MRTLRSALVLSTVSLVMNTCLLNNFVLAADSNVAQAQNSVGSVHIAQASAEKMIRPPGILGLSEVEAQRELKSSGHTGKVAVFATSKTVKCLLDTHNSLAPGFVCQTKPDLRHVRELPADAEIALLVQGERDLDEPYGIPPKVIGLPRKESERVLAEQRFTNIEYRFVEESGCQAGLVCRLPSQRADGTWERHAVSRDMVLLLYVGTSHPRGDNRQLDGSMISIIGDTVDEALDKLDKFGVRGGIHKDLRSKPCLEEHRYLGEGRICNQKPAVGEYVGSHGVGYVLSTQSKPTVPKQSADDSPFAEGKSKEK